jgi:succinyl-CoA synthetase alpha subunit
MTVLVNKKTRVVVQGITGRQGAFHTRTMLEYGTRGVAGVTPGKGGAALEGVPVYDTLREACAARQPNTSVVFVPREHAADAVLEAIDNGMRLVVVITEHLPVHDVLRFLQYAKLKGAAVIGPNTPGIIAPPARVKVGIMPNNIFVPGNIGVLSRSGTLTYEIVDNLKEAGSGVSTCVGLGGDIVVGQSFTEILAKFEKDSDTDAIVLIGEIGGSAEERAARYIAKMKKPVFAYVAGLHAPSEKRMGHAGAIVTRGRGTALSKICALRAAGAEVAETPAQVAQLVKENVK